MQPCYGRVCIKCNLKWIELHNIWFDFTSCIQTNNLISKMVDVINLECIWKILKNRPCIFYRRSSWQRYAFQWIYYLLLFLFDFLNSVCILLLILRIYNKPARKRTIYVLCNRHNFYLYHLPIWKKEELWTYIESNQEAIYVFRDIYQCLLHLTNHNP